MPHSQSGLNEIPFWAASLAFPLNAFTAHTAFLPCALRAWALPTGWHRLPRRATARIFERHRRACTHYTRRTSFPYECPSPAARGRPREEDAHGEAVHYTPSHETSTCLCPTPHRRRLAQRCLPRREEVLSKALHKSCLAPSRRGGRRATSQASRERQCMRSMWTGWSARLSSSMAP